jgi:fructose-1,6-bisphosphatase I
MGDHITLQRYINENNSFYPEVSHQFTSLFWEFILAIKSISREVKRAGLVDLLGMAGTQNVHGEEVQKLDVYAHNNIVEAMGKSGALCAMASEEYPEIIQIPNGYKCGDYVLLFDPLDGSSNIDVNISIGTIFSIYKRLSLKGPGTLQDCLQPGLSQVASGYVMYGSSIMLVFTTGKGVHGFTFDQTLGEFLLSHPNIKTPNKGSIYSINEGNSKYWDKATSEYINYLKRLDKPYSLRYVGTLVADFHRTLINGGIFLYPASPKPKLRLLYELSPMSFIAEQAGGMATTGSGRVLEIMPTDLHQKAPFITGSRDDVVEYEKFVQKFK